MPKANDPVKHENFMKDYREAKWIKSFFIMAYSVSGGRGSFRTPCDPQLMQELVFAWIKKVIS